MLKSDIQGKTTKQLVDWYNANSGLPLIKKFSDRKTAEKRIAHIIELKEKGSAQVLGVAPSATKPNGKAAESKTAIKQAKNEHQFIAIKVEGNPRRDGTVAADKWNEMTAYLAKHSGASVADVFRHTAYQRVDLNWDLKRGSIEVKNG